MWVTLLPSIVTVVVVPTVAFLSVHWAFGRFRSEKWWERRADSYASVVTALHHFKVYYDDLSAPALGYSERTNEYWNELSKRCADQQKELELRIDLGALFLPSSAIEEIKSAVSAIHGDSYNNCATDEDYHAHFHEQSKRIEQCLDRLIKVARKDLRFRSWRRT